MRFAVLGSGSRGNGTLVASNDTYVLVDCGFSLRETERRLARLGVAANQLSAILVTHEHADHVHGVGLLSRRYNVPVYLSSGTLRGMRKPVEVAGLLAGGESLQVGALGIDVVSVAHDALEPTQFVFNDGKRRFGLLTDLGSYCSNVLQHYQGLDALMIEANHCRDMLARGQYPVFLKQRVGCETGHLNNHQAASLVSELGWQDLQHLVLAHLSSKNNLPHLARQCFVDTLGCDPDWLQLADQDSGLDWRHIA
ncbi:beta-lactamase [Pseudomonas amygdali pv. tabaci str. ATCC 11528]|uniref:Metallo-beta-lactamase protein n=2 Tax=Pseudomonas syringae group genomosp. 2 TaxID=251698 RepID=A0AAX1VUA0_PSEAJ|nr:MULTISPECIES: MBL fold metallo-hydrolase [Pseudomonas syringae group]KEZ68319.1 beta-lactamase [Pseudomonas amygdali pv. tabaci str. ATCC 11528]KIY17276.1 beta-lactamase [Pseudomonas amygdali pv. tabaci]KKY54673.1 beta-lactamase [Pseudomonas amygdali pv. tabaci str. ATCC 11528]KPY84800.1 Metallo-beta-lactamase family protein [Pseudomonas amygdali pv. tabaci]MDU8607782.1 MBL fold metallo-hydrolase [Pseudomonas syringae group sp. 247E2]